MNQNAMLVLILVTAFWSFAGCEGNTKKDERPTQVDTIEANPDELLWYEANQPNAGENTPASNEADEEDASASMNSGEPYDPEGALPLDGASMSDEGKVVRHGFMEIRAGKGDPLSALRTMMKWYDATILVEGSNSLTWRMPAKNLQRLMEFVRRSDDMQLANYEISYHDHTLEYESYQNRVKLVNDAIGKLPTNLPEYPRQVELLEQRKEDYMQNIRSIDAVAGTIELSFRVVR